MAKLYRASLYENPDSRVLNWYLLFNEIFIEIYIENFNDLKLKPVSDLYIMSLTFGDVIKNKVKPHLINYDVIHQLVTLIGKDDVKSSILEFIE